MNQYSANRDFVRLANTSVWYAWLFQRFLHCCEALWVAFRCLVKRQELAAPLLDRGLPSNSTKGCLLERAVGWGRFVSCETIEGCGFPIDRQKASLVASKSDRNSKGNGSCRIVTEGKGDKVPFWMPLLSTPTGNARSSRPRGILWIVEEAPREP